MFFTASVLRSLRLFKLKTEGQTIVLPRDYEFEFTPTLCCLKQKQFPQISLSSFHINTVYFLKSSVLRDHP